MFSVAILALLAAAATPYLEKTIQRKKEGELRTHLREIRTAIDAYKKAADTGKITKPLGESGYPKRLEDLVLGVPNITDPQKKKLRFLRRLPADPMYVSGSTYLDKAELKPTNTWGKRSYDSDADNPREGVDVYDVYSRNNQKGLNGVPYRQW
ncbi:MAG: hypothetical protein ACKE5M_06310 [Methylophilaceae bacterium]